MSRTVVLSLQGPGLGDPWRDAFIKTDLRITTGEEGVGIPPGIPPTPNLLKSLELTLKG